MYSPSMAWASKPSTAGPDTMSADHPLMAAALGSYPEPARAKNG
ncbi:hypothetical protein R1X32_33950 [Rhodococcus opacus]|nr:hypothetical protein [Rhodococcus opacus]WKN59579.1 hypothetical protein HJ581_0017820 [Rhodococcus opacus]